MPRTCICGASLEGRRPNARTCSPKCRVAAVRARGTMGSRAGHVGHLAPAPAEQIAPTPASVPPWEISRARKEAAQAALAELELERERGRLVAARDVARGIADMIIACRAKLLGVPSRAKQAMPELTSEQVDVIDSLVREALEELALDRPAEPPEDDPPDQH